jgi:hypothetical protein
VRPWAIASLLSLIGITLLLGSLHANPAMPQVPGEKIAAARATGVFAVTRHPMMWGIALWALAHVLVAPTPRDRADGGHGGAGAGGRAVAGWEKGRTAGRRMGKLERADILLAACIGTGRISPMLWGVGIVVWLGATFGHVHANHVLAGVWRWVLGLCLRRARAGALCNPVTVSVALWVGRLV